MFSELFSGLKSNRGCSVLFGSLIHVLRRVVFVLVALNLHKSPWIQAILFIMVSLTNFTYLLATSPYESQSQNRLEAANEAMILLTGYCIAISAGWNMTSDIRNLVGLVTVFIVLSVIVLNVGRWTVFMIKYGKMHWQKYLIKKKIQTLSSSKQDD